MIRDTGSPVLNGGLPAQPPVSPGVFVRFGTSWLRRASLAGSLLAAGCGLLPKQQETVVAQIGDRIITVAEFRSNYEFGMPFLKKGQDPKATYLDYMIREKLLALEGYRLGFDRNPQVQKNEKALLPELLIEELFDHEIRQKITINPEEIREGIIRAKVRWKFRYWFEPGLADARQIQAAMKEQGYARIVAELLEGNPEIKMKPKDFESGYVTWLEIDPAILEAIKDLPVGEISEPLNIHGTWVLFQITDIQRDAFTENALREGAESMRQTLFYRKAQAAVRHYVDSLMTPKNVRTKMETFLLLADATTEWMALEPARKGDFRGALAAAGPDTPHLLKLRNSMNNTLMQFEGGAWTIADLLERFDPGSIKTPAGNREALRSDLNRQLALTLRNHFLAAEARKLSLQNSPGLRRALQQWRDKWVYDESRSYFLRNINLDSATVRSFFDKNISRYRLHKGKEPVFADFREEAKRDAWLQAARQILIRQADVLKEQYPVTIHRTVLDTLTVTSSANSRWMSVQLYKSGSRHMANPIADPAWGL